MRNVANTEQFEAWNGDSGQRWVRSLVAAFVNIAGALGDGGRLCIATWQPRRANGWLTVPGSTMSASTAASIPVLKGLQGGIGWAQTEGFANPAPFRPDS